ncbi:hypothetical protein HYT33_01600 [Candidatus Roizmanbacteria bacterium]|nr:hypothetical protein [Candidatus Roizmanbacteria bacterium]
MERIKPSTPFLRELKKIGRREYDIDAQVGTRDFFLDYCGLFADPELFPSKIINEQMNKLRERISKGEISLVRGERLTEDLRERGEAEFVLGYEPKETIASYIPVYGWVLILPAGFEQLVREDTPKQWGVIMRESHELFLRGSFDRFMSREGLRLEMSQRTDPRIDNIMSSRITDEADGMLAEFLRTYQKVDPSFKPTSYQKRILDKVPDGFVGGSQRIAS